MNRTDAAAAPHPLASTLTLATALLALPFDALRLQYGSAVGLGLAPRSLVAAGRFDHLVAALEATLLGPFARRV